MMRKSELFGIILLITLLFVASGADALPTLQLDIEGGWYDNKTETIMSPGEKFTLYAYLTDVNADLNNPYYISMALVPPTKSEIDLGYFYFENTKIQVTDGMKYGVPPLETALSPDKGDLPTHGIYETFFAEYKFNFKSDQWVYQYNTQDQRWPAPDTGKDIMYYQVFSVDTSGLEAGYSIHFDLYNSTLYDSIMQQIESNESLSDIDASLFAPFSHDAESTTEKVPEPGTLLYLGFALGLVGAVGYGRKINLL